MAWDKFQSTRPARGATFRRLISMLVRRFQSTRPARGATARTRSIVFLSSHFNPRAPRGARLCIGKTVCKLTYNFNPRAPRGARLASQLSAAAVTRISIHAPREGRDRSPLSRSFQPTYFNPRAPRGARLARAGQSVVPVVFQSTRPARGATKVNIMLSVAQDISIHAPREGRDCQIRLFRSLRAISIHAPREGRDFTVQARFMFPLISIHAPREGRDCKSSGTR